MFCTSCGQEMAPQARACGRCGVPSGLGRAYCWRCGRPLEAGASACACGTPVPPPPAQRPPYQTNGYRSRTAAGVLGILLGAVGAHNFYLGYTGRAVAQLLITVVSCGALSPVSAIWGLVEGIIILTDRTFVDVEGYRLSD